MLYFAYGSNLSKKQMLCRCPGNAPLGRASLPGFRLAFAGMSQRWDNGGTATIIPSEGSLVEGALYDIGPADENSLDRHEGYPNAYDKMEIAIEGEPAFTYYRTNADPHLPCERYIERLKTGYRDWGIPTDALDAVLTLEDMEDDSGSRKYLLQPELQDDCDRSDPNPPPEKDLEA